MKTKITLLQRFVYFFDLRAYEQRLEQEAKQVNAREKYLEYLLLSSQDSDCSQETKALINQEVLALKERKERLLWALKNHLG